VQLRSPIYTPNEHVALVEELPDLGREVLARLVLPRIPLGNLPAQLLLLASVSLQPRRVLRAGGPLLPPGSDGRRQVYVHVHVQLLSSPLSKRDKDGGGGFF
jgi:hypothetical protein